MFMLRIVAVLAVMAAGLVFAAPGAWSAVQEGDAEVSIFGSVSTIDVEGSTSDQITAQVLGGVFVTDEVEVGGSFLTIGTFSDAGDASVEIVNGFAKLHFNPAEDTVPYVGGQAGVVSVTAGDFSDNGTSIGFMAGVKIFATEDLSYNIEFNWQETEIFDVDATSTTLLVGVSVYFDT